MYIQKNKNNHLSKAIKQDKRWSWSQRKAVGEKRGNKF